MKDKKTIGITLRFWTNNLPERVGKKGDKVPFWTCGNAHLEAKPAKGVRSQDVLFHYLDDIPRAIRGLMKKGNLAAVEDVAYSLRAEKRHQANK